MKEQSWILSVIAIVMFICFLRFLRWFANDPIPMFFYFLFESKNSARVLKEKLLDTKHQGVWTPKRKGTKKKEEKKKESGSTWRVDGHQPFVSGLTWEFNVTFSVRILMAILFSVLYVAFNCLFYWWQVH